MKMLNKTINTQRLFMKKVILISGRMQNGKNTFANFLQEKFEKLNFKVSQDYFAKDLKNICKNDFQKLTIVLDSIADEIKSQIGLFVDLRQLILAPSILNKINENVDKLKIKNENWFNDKTPITRSLLQIVGTDIIKKRVDDNYWVKQVKDRCIASNDDIIIVTDCRFPNEITEMICDEYETVVIRINRDINTQELIASHDSETALNDWKEFDFIVENNGSLEDLKASATSVVDYLTEEQPEEDIGLFKRVSKENLQFLSKIF